MYDPVFVVEAGGVLQYTFPCDDLAAWFREVDPDVRARVTVFIVDESGVCEEVRVNG